MPHRVAALFRARSNSPGPTALDCKKKTSTTLSSALTGKPVVRVPSIASSSSSSSTLSTDSILSMPDVHKRLSLAGKAPVPQHPATMSVQMESPPPVFYGPPDRSTGALLSGQLKLVIGDNGLVIESFRMVFVLEQKIKKPFHGHCNECTYRITQLGSWNFLQSLTALQQGEHDFPFSHLLSGDLPAAMHGVLSSIEYVLKATIIPRSGEPITLNKILDVKRAIQPTEIPRQSLRVFPPTNLTASIDLPAVIHPIGEFTAHLRIDGAVRRNLETKTQTQWRLKKLNWRLLETQKVVSPPCPKHALKAGAIPDEKGTPHKAEQMLNSGELRTGWKCDYNNPDGCIEMEFSYSIRSDVTAICDTKAQHGTEVAHALIVELIVAEEIAPMRKPSQCTPTGAARILRMQFSNILTERSGLGISWDEEQPPLYENVPASPPRYGTVCDLHEAPIPDYEELDRLQN